MNKKNKMLSWIFCVVAAGVLTFGTAGLAQTKPAVPAKQATAPAPTEQDVAATQDQLLKLLRLSPTLTSVVARDPSLLTDQPYVSRNNPQLAQFLVQHPEVVRNPEFYLFTNLPANGNREHALERQLWPEYLHGSNNRDDAINTFITSELAPVIIIPCIFLAIAWSLRAFIAGHRQNRNLKVQSELQNHLIDKLGSSQELSAYLSSEAGKRLLEATPVSASEAKQQEPSAMARVLISLQTGIVLLLLGAGFLFLGHAHPQMDLPMRVLGTVTLLPGLGFILSAGITWVLARRLGLMPESPSAAKTLEPPSDPQDRQ
jgi:hypothetical protein